MHPLTPGGDGPTQQVADGSVAFVQQVPGFGLAELAATAIDDRVTVTEHSFTNGFVAVSWDLEGTITSIIDVRAGRQLLPAGKTVTLEMAADHPIEYDAWDLEEWTRASGVTVGGVESCEVVDAGPLLARLRVRRVFGNSTLVHDLVVRAGSARIDLTFDIDWHESEHLLTLMVPLDVHARQAACDIQFGHVLRPTHPSSSWDAAKFEVCAHRYVDISEPAFGVAVLNDGRYGHGVQAGGISVSLLRAAKFPDPLQDQGRHAVTIGILPHGSGLHEVIREAEALNTPLRVVAGGHAESVSQPIVIVEHPGVEVSAVKLADDGSGDLIVRLAEVCGDRVHVPVRPRGGITAAFVCNLLEEEQSAVDVADGFVNLDLRPFELVTLRLRA
jgi:alpha-mannosidase